MPYRKVLSPDQQSYASSFVMKAILYLLIAGSLFLLYIFALLFWPSDPFQVKSVQFTKDGTVKTVRGGEAFSYTINYCKSAENGGEISRQLINDKNVITFVTITSVVPNGCGEREIILQMPNGVPTGEYHLRASVDFKVNALQEKTVTFETQDTIRVVE